MSKINPIHLDLKDLFQVCVELRLELAAKDEEIEALKNVIEVLNDECKSRIDHETKQQAENKRYREALEKIECETRYGRIGHMGDCSCFRCSIHIAVIKAFNKEDNNV